jgi:hypothetical protein
MKQAKNDIPFMALKSYALAGSKVSFGMFKDTGETGKVAAEKIKQLLDNSGILNNFSDVQQAKAEIMKAAEKGEQAWGGYYNTVRDNDIDSYCVLFHLDDGKTVTLTKPRYPDGARPNEMPSSQYQVVMEIKDPSLEDNGSYYNHVGRFLIAGPDQGKLLGAQQNVKSKQEENNRWTNPDDESSQAPKAIQEVLEQIANDPDFAGRAHVNVSPFTRGIVYEKLGLTKLFNELDKKDHYEKTFEVDVQRLPGVPKYNEIRGKVKITIKNPGKDDPFRGNEPSKDRILVQFDYPYGGREDKTFASINRHGEMIQFQDDTLDRKDDRWPWNGYELKATLDKCLKDIRTGAVEI